MITLTLPLPPSANHYKKPSRWGRGRMYLTDEARHYHATVRTIGLSHGIEPIASGFVALRFVVYRGETMTKRGPQLRRGDLDGYQKVLQDALQGVAYRNDSQIRRYEAELHEDRARPRVEVTVSQIETVKR